MNDPPTFDDIREAASRIAPYVHRTPVLSEPAMDALVGCRAHFKCEHQQRAGAFKARGALNAVLSLSDADASRGVAAHSSGNHAAALALAAQIRGVPCHVVMPSNAPEVKRARTAGYGAEIVLCEPTLEAREATLADVLARTGAVEVHPYDDPAVIAGQGTATMELLEQAPALGAVIAPVSGGGLLSGTAIAAHGLRSDLAVWGAEPMEVDDAHRSLTSGVRTSAGNRTSIADGLLAVLSDRTFAILRQHGVQVVTVSEDEIIDAGALVFTHLAQVVEPSAATAVAGLIALARRGVDLPDDVGVILSGGNVDPEPQRSIPVEAP